MKIINEKNIYLQNGNTDIIVEAKDEENGLMDLKKMDDIDDNIDFSIGMISVNCIYEKSNNENILFNMQGVSLSDLKKMNNYLPVNKDNNNNFEGNNIIISKNTADKNNLSIGDEIKVNIYDKEYNLKIYNINQNEGIFNSGGFYDFVAVPLDFAKNLIYSEGKVNKILIKVKNKDKIKDTIDLLKKYYPNSNVRETISQDEIDKNIGSIATTFDLIKILVVIISMYLIHTTYKVFILERIPTIGTLRSIGATKLQVRKILLFECLIYGLIGGLMSILFGVILTNVLKYVVDWGGISSGINHEISITISNCIIALVLTLIATIMSAILPIIKVGNKKILSMIYNDIESNKKMKISTSIIGILLIIISIVITFVPANIDGLSQMCGMIAVISPLIGIIMAIHIISYLFAVLLKKIYRFILGNDGSLALENIKIDGNIRKNIGIVFLSISGIILAASIGISIISSTEDFFKKDVKFDIWMSGESLDNKVVDEIKNIKDVSEVYGSKECYDVQVVNSDYKISRIINVLDDNKKILDLINFNIDKSIVNKTYNERSIVVTQFLKDKFNLKVGDEIELRLESSNVKYKVVGFCDTVLDGGSVGLALENYLYNDVKDKNYQYIYIKTTGDQNKVIESIQAKLNNLKPTLVTTDDLCKEQNMSNEKLTTILEVFIVVLVVVSLFGIVNNFIISMMAREKKFAILRSLGMSIQQKRKIICIEALTCGILGGVFVSAIVALITYIMPYFFKTVDAPPINFSYPTKIVVVGGIVSIAVMLIGCILALLRKERNIVDLIKQK